MGGIFLFGINSADAQTKILIVPGHDDQFWGTDYRGMKEANFNLALAQEIYQYFSKDPNFEAYITRDEIGYTEPFINYFEANLDNIKNFISEKANQMQEKLLSGQIVKNQSVPHNVPPQDVIHRLYGINKWANDNEMDIILHIHFNDVPRSNRSIPGKYSGMAIYIPERQYQNFRFSKDIAELVSARLQFYATSSLPKEDVGIVEDQGLIATGSNNSINRAAVMLIEYGYIYEPSWQGKKIRDKVFSDLALQTYTGIQDYFGVHAKNQTKYFPYNWKKDLARGLKSDLDVLSLQAALMHEGVYPGKGKTKNDCPLTGNFGPCTEAAVKAFQKKYGIAQVGKVGPLTRAKLNKLYSK